MDRIVSAADSSVSGNAHAKPPAGIASLECKASQTRRGGIVWGALTVITCPCHVLIVAALLSGTALGALLKEHFTLTLVLFTLVFLLSLRAFTRTLSRTSSRSD